MSIVHISEEDAVRDFAAVLAKLDSGDEVTIDRNGPGAPIRIMRDAARASSQALETANPENEDSLEYLSEFRQRHPEPLDSSKWD